jgi:hypothetical protein
MVFGVVLFGFATFRPGLAAELGHKRHAGMIARGQVNYGAGFFALVAAVSAFNYAWRWVDRVAISADVSGLRFHRSTWRKALPWDSIRSVHFPKDRLSGRLAIATIDGASFSIPMLNPREGRAFAEAVTQRWLSSPASSSTPRAT